MTPDDITRLADLVSELHVASDYAHGLKAKIERELRTLAQQGKAGGVAEAYGVHDIDDLSRWVKAPHAVVRHRDEVLVAHCTHRDSAEQVAAALNGQPNMVMPLDEAIRIGNAMLATPPANPPEAGVTDTDRLNWIVDSWGKDPGPLHTAVTEAFRKEDRAAVRDAIDAALAPQPKDAER